MTGRVRSRFITGRDVRLPHRHEAPAVMPYAVRMREGRWCCCSAKGYIDGRERNSRQRWHRGSRSVVVSIAAAHSSSI
jgi:hypothetical protein